MTGQAALSMVLLVGGIVVVVGVTLAFLALSFLNSSFSFQAANRALALASSGINDAVLRLVRDNYFAPFDTFYCVPGPAITSEGGMEGGGAAIECPSASAKVTIADVIGVPNQKLITSEASVGQSKRKIEVVVAVSASTTQVSMLSWRLAPI